MLYKDFMLYTGMNHQDIACLDGVTQSATYHDIMKAARNQDNNTPESVALTRHFILFQHAVDDVRKYYQRLTHDIPECYAIPESMRKAVVKYSHITAIVDGYYDSAVSDRELLLCSQWGVDIP